MKTPETLFYPDIKEIINLAYIPYSSGEEYSEFLCNDYSKKKGQILSVNSRYSLDLSITIDAITTAAALWSTPIPGIDLRTRWFCQKNHLPYPKIESIRISEKEDSVFDFVGFDIFMPHKAVNDENGSNYLEKWVTHNPNQILLACYRIFINIGNVQNCLDAAGMEIIPMIYDKKLETFTRILSPGVVITKLTSDTLDLIFESMKLSRNRSRSEFPLAVISDNKLPSKDNLYGDQKGIIKGFIPGNDIKI